MEPIDFFPPETEQPSEFELGTGLWVNFLDAGKRAVLFRGGVQIKELDLGDKVAFRLFLVETMELGANQTKLSNVFKISRQTLHNYRECKKHFGLEGLIHNYGPRKGNIKATRLKHKNKLDSGDTAEKLRKIRQKEKQEKESTATQQMNFDNLIPEAPVTEKGAVYETTHNWKSSRYAGISLYLPVLLTRWKWLKLIQGIFGRHFQIFLVFLLMTARNIKSIEKLKNICGKEAATVLGLRQFPHPKMAREWLYKAAKMKRSAFLLYHFFKFQLREGLVNYWLIFTDGHLLPYSGKDRVHHAYNTQRQMPMPGQTNQVSCDSNGQIIDFTIQEGKGDMKQHIIELSERWKDEIPINPVHVFDREGSGKEFFFNLVDRNIQFVAWEKHLDKQKLDQLDQDLFSEVFQKHGKEYRIFEGTKKFKFKPEGKRFDCVFTLRRIYLWNIKSDHRTCILSWSNPAMLSTKDCATAMLSRWGASENTFKHLKNRHPLHYHPGFKKVESEKQDIANPELKAKRNQLSRLKNEIKRIQIELSQTRVVTNKDGSIRKNNKHDRLTQEIEKQQNRSEQLKEEIKKLPERIDVSTLTDYNSFKQIDNEGKNLFDFVTSSVWNARKWLVNQLLPYFDHDTDEVVDLFYTLTECHGWVKTTSDSVYFRLEPLSQPKRRAAQEAICRSITNLGAFTPNGKRMIIEVGGKPF